MSTLKSSMLGAGCIFVAANAFAADMREYPYKPPLPEAKPAPVTYTNPLGFGWYLRGDLGYRMGHVRRAEPDPPFASSSEDKLGGAVTAGLGAGIRSRWLRTDLTFDYGGAQKYQGTIATTNDTSAKIQAHNLLFNGYIDLGTWTLLTPYIGAGLGAAYVRTSEYSSTGAPPFTPVPANTQWNFAWALMAGAAFQVAPNLQIDAGYRFLSVGDAKTGADAFGRRMTFRDVHNHEIRVGLRWSYDDLRPLQ